MIFSYTIFKLINLQKGVYIYNWGGGIESGPLKFQIINPSTSILLIMISRI